MPLQIPDIDAVVQTGNFPCVKRDPSMMDRPRGPGGPNLAKKRPIPLFSFASGEDYRDIPFPDSTFYGGAQSISGAPGGIMSGSPVGHRRTLGWRRRTHACR